MEKHPKPINLFQKINIPGPPTRENQMDIMGLVELVEDYGQQKIVGEVDERNHTILEYATMYSYSDLALLLINKFGILCKPDHADGTSSALGFACNFGLDVVVQRMIHLFGKKCGNKKKDIRFAMYCAFYYCSAETAKMVYDTFGESYLKKDDFNRSIEVKRRCDGQSFFDWYYQYRKAKVDVELEFINGNANKETKLMKMISDGIKNPNRNEAGKSIIKFIKKNSLKLKVEEIFRKTCMEQGKDILPQPCMPNHCGKDGTTALSGATILCYREVSLCIIKWFDDCHPDLVSGSHETPLSLACDYAYDDVVQLLIKRFEDRLKNLSCEASHAFLKTACFIGIIQSAKQKILELAFKRCRKDTVGMVVELFDELPHSMNCQDQNNLPFAEWLTHYQEEKEFIEQNPKNRSRLQQFIWDKGSDLKEPDEMEEAENEILALMDELYNYFPDHVDADGNTALTLAIYGRYEKVCLRLIDDGPICLPSHIDKAFDGTPLIHACMASIPNVVLRLIQRFGKDCKPKHVDREGSTALIYAIRYGGFEKVVKAMINIFGNKCNPSQTDSDGNTALILAVRSSNKKIADLLIDKCGKKCNPEQINKDGETVIYWSTFNSQEQLFIKLLQKYGKKCKLKHLTNGETPLMSAAEVGYDEGIRVLCDLLNQWKKDDGLYTDRSLERRWICKAKHTDSEKRSALSLAFEHCSKETVKLMLETFGKQCIKGTVNSCKDKDGLMFQTWYNTNYMTKK